LAVLTVATTAALVRGEPRGVPVQTLTTSPAATTDERSDSPRQVGLGRPAVARPAEPTTLPVNDDAPADELERLGRRLLPTATSVLLPTPDGVSREVMVPVLMYHHIGDPGPDADAIRRDLSVSPANFESQLRYLIESGYESISLEALVMHLQAGQPLPSKPVVLTFDDGFKDQYSNAYPLLQKYGLVGTFFVITCFTDQNRPEYLSWPEIELLHAGGMEIGSHSYTHPSLRGQTFEYVVWQVLGSKEAIEARTHEPVRFFSYPSGQYDQLVMQVLRSAGYWGAVTVEPGSLQSSERTFELKRVRVRGSYDVEDFDYWLNHWLSSP
jgi:peptidoglycan/xylan/chitin deacetylase (PgdA/CDA1 family)